MVLKFEGFKMLNESFKSSTISKLFRDGELVIEKERDKALFNQVEEDEIIGIADDENAAKKMLHDALGDMIETRYKAKRVWYRTGEDDWDDDIIEDPNQPYEVNKTVDEYSNWIFELSSGKYLVLSIEVNELHRRYSKITGNRYHDYSSKVSDLKKKFIERKKFVEKHKNDLKEFRNFVDFLNEKNLLDEFIEVVNKKLIEIDRKTDGDAISYTIEEKNNEFNEYVQFDFHGYDVTLDIDFFAEYDCTYHEGSSGDYWTPPEYGGYEYEDIHFKVNDMYICFEGGEDDVCFEFYYNPLFDKNIKIDFK